MTPGLKPAQILRSTGGSTVRLKDVAAIVDGYEDRISTTRLDGADSVSFSVRKQAGGNTVAITDAAHLRKYCVFDEIL